MKLIGNDRGFTLIEVLIATGILGAIMGVMSMTIVTIVKISPFNNDWAVALQQVQNAGHWISRDIQMAQIVSPQPGAGVLVTFEWEDGEGGIYEVDYVFSGDRLERQMNGSSGMVIARHIVEGHTSFTPEADNVYRLTIEASRGEVEVGRSYVVNQRVDTE